MARRRGVTPSPSERPHHTGGERINAHLWGRGLAYRPWGAALSEMGILGFGTRGGLVSWFRGHRGGIVVAPHSSTRAVSLTHRIEARTPPDDCPPADISAVGGGMQTGVALHRHMVGGKEGGAKACPSAESS